MRWSWKSSPREIRERFLSLKYCGCRHETDVSQHMGMIVYIVFCLLVLWGSIRHKSPG
jgi:ribosomal protein S27E